jgi:hypothetical protein
MNLFTYGVTLSPQFTPDYPFETKASVHQAPAKTVVDSHYLTGPWQPIAAQFDPIELAWQHYFANETPNGSLIKSNSLFESIQSGQDYVLLHITPSYDLIRQSGLLYPSGGSLGSTVYCVPLHSDGSVHNLINFILDYEIPQSHKARGITDKSPKLLAISINKDTYSKANLELGGLDHLLLGNLQCDIYEEFLRDANVTAEHQRDLEKRMLARVRRNAGFFNLCNEYNLSSVSDSHFFESFNELLRSNPFFGYVYFEVLVEYAALFQNDQVTRDLKEQGEFNNHNHKKMIFEVADHLLSSFKLIEFRSSVERFGLYEVETCPGGTL